MPRKDLVERVRDQMGAEGPQLPTEEYEQRIDEELERMSAKRLLELLSYTFNWDHLKSD